MPPFKAIRGFQALLGSKRPFAHAGCVSIRGLQPLKCAFGGRLRLLAYLERALR